MSPYQRMVSRFPSLGEFNSIPASMIDRAYRNNPKGMLGRISNFIKIRTIYTLLFLPLSVFDLISSGLLAIYHAFRTFFTTDEIQEHQLAQQKKYTTIFSKNLYSLVASILGFFSPKLTAFYFILEQPNQTGVRAGGNYYHAPNAILEEPESIDELQRIIKEAVATGKKIMPMGAGRSQGKQFLPDGDEDTIVIDLSKLNTVEIHVADQQAIVGAGARWYDVQQKANEHKLALKVMQASNVFSVGGSLGTNIHGWDHRTGVLSNTISSIEIVNTQGILQILTPEDELFHHVTGGIGLYGIVVKATINLTDNELLKEKGFEVTPGNYTQYFRDTVQHDETARMHLYRLSLDPKNLLRSGVAVSFVKENDSNPVVTSKFKMEAEKGSRFDRVMINLARRVPFVRKQYWEGERARLLENNGPEISTNEIMQPPINAMFNNAVSEGEWLQEYFLPEEQLPVFLHQLGDLLMANHVALINASVRFVKQHQSSLLSYAHDGDRFAVVLCFNQSLEETALIKAKKWLRKAQHLAIEHGGTYYLPYQHVSSPDDFNLAYPHAEEAMQAKDEVDPEHVFVSGFYHKYLERKPFTINHFKVMMASEASKKKFAGFLNNVLQRLDSEAFFTLLEDIMEYNDTHEEIYRELCHRLPEITSNVIADLRHILNSLSAIKTDLAEQAHSLLPDDFQTIDGLVEIGYPGRFVNGFKQNYTVIGEVVAVYEAPSVTDYIQTGFPRPYDRFEPLDYNKPSLKNLKDNSADVVTCYVGLHHFPKDELEFFLEDIRRVLRPGGHFLLVDHDVVDDESMSMAHMAHTIFNAATGVSVEEEMKETRDFAPMEYWTTLLAKHGLGVAIEGENLSLIRNGDPSRNRMVSFAKPMPQLQLDDVVEIKPVKPNGSAINKTTFVAGQSAYVTDSMQPGRSRDSIFALETTTEDASIPVNDASITFN